MQVITMSTALALTFLQSQAETDTQVHLVVFSLSNTHTVPQTHTHTYSYHHGFVCISTLFLMWVYKFIHINLPLDPHSTGVTATKKLKKIKKNHCTM